MRKVNFSTFVRIRLSKSMRRLLLGPHFFGASTLATRNKHPVSKFSKLIGFADITLREIVT